MMTKIAGCLYGAAIGDAMGAATEGLSRTQISAQFGGPVTEFMKPRSGSQAYGRKAGQVTDAFSIPAFFLEDMGNCTGPQHNIGKIAEQSLVRWGESKFFETFAGMTTRKAIKGKKQIEKIGEWDYAGHLGNKLFKGHYYALSSNGAACKAFPAGLLSRGDLDTAIQYAMEISVSSHDDPYSISGACAVAAAVSEGLKPDSTLYQIVQAGLYGAEKGESLARARQDLCVYPGPSVQKRMEMAIDIALGAGGGKHIIEELADQIGSGPAMAETVPTAFGVLIAEKGDPMKSIIGGVNVGDETSAVASIAGAICGCFKGSAAIPIEYRRQIEDNNSFDFQ